MLTLDSGLKARTSLGDNSASLELHVGRSVFPRGGSLSGVVVLRLNKRVSIRALMVSVAGGEYVPASTYKGSVRVGDSFFRRDALLSGRDRPRLISDRLSLFWNAFLRREKYRSLAEGEHVYPFTLPLPASLPPTCEGKAGKIVYQVSARLKFPLGGTLQVTADVPVAFSSGGASEEPFEFSHSSVFGGRHATGADVTLKLPGRVFEVGGQVAGRLEISNPRNLDMSSISINLDLSDGARSSRGNSEARACIDSVTINPQNPKADTIEADFSLQIPPESPPSVDGSALLVSWSLAVSVEACPPLQMRVPVIVRIPVT